jgi:hypothetical protein
MAISTEQYNRLLARLTKTEETLNDLIVASKHYVSMSQVNQLNTIVTTQLADIRNTVESLEDRVESIEEEPMT